MKISKLALIVLLLLIPIAFFYGYRIASFRYLVPLANCNPTHLDNEDVDNLEVSEYFNQLLQNFYGDEYTFTHIYIPKGMNFIDYLDNFNSGGFHLLQTTTNEVVACGIYK